MLIEILLQAWDTLRRNPTRSLLTMLGIVWGITAVTLLMAYGDGFSAVMLRTFNNFSKSAVIAFPGQTSEQVGGERAGRRVRFEIEDLQAAQAESSLIKKVCPESIRRYPVSWHDQSFDLQIRGVCQEYGEIRTQQPSEGRWISAEDYAERRRVVVVGGWAKQKLFRGRNPMGETVSIRGVRFLVIGVLDRKMSFGNYMGPDERALFIPFTTAGEVWDTKYIGTVVIQPIAPQFEEKAERQFREAIARRRGFSPSDKRAIESFGSSFIRPIIMGITIGLQVLLTVIGTLTLAIGGVGLMNILLVSVNERTREIGIRRALGAKRIHIALQFLAEALALTVAGGILGLGLSYAISAIIPPQPMLGAIFKDDSGKGDLVMRVRLQPVLISVAVLMLVGVISGLVPAIRAARLEPTEALRTE